MRLTHSLWTGWSLFLIAGIFAWEQAPTVAVCLLVMGMVVILPYSLGTMRSEGLSGSESPSRGLVLLVPIIVLGSILRFFELDQIPSGLAGDEALNVIDAKAILDGQNLNPYTSGNWSNPRLFHYVFAVLMYWGLSGFWALKVAAVAAGVLTILFIYKFSNELFGKTVAISSAYFAAISSWLLINSRIGYLITFESALAASGLYLITLTVRYRRLSHAILTGLVVAIALVMTRPVAMLAVFLGIACAVAFFHRAFRRSRNPLMVASAVALLLSFPRLILIVENPETISRLREVFLFDSTAWGAAKAADENGMVHNFIRLLAGFNLEAGYAARWNIGSKLPALDVVSGSLLLVGLSYVVCNAFRSGRFAFLICCFILSFIPASISLALDDDPVMYRLYLLAPCIFSLIGIGFQRVSCSLPPRYVASCLCWWDTFNELCSEFSCLFQYLSRKILRFPFCGGDPSGSFCG